MMKEIEFYVENLFFDGTGVAEYIAEIIANLPACFDDKKIGGS